jgi:regulatory GntR family protein
VPTLGERIVEHLHRNGASLDDGELAEALGVHRPVIAETCRQLEAEGLVVRNIAGGTRPVAPPVPRAAPAASNVLDLPPANPQLTFPAHARRVLSARWGSTLQRRTAVMPGGEARPFELVSGNGRIVGDVVWLEGRGDAEAKWATIAEAVLIVGHVTRADRRFLVFGQDREVVGGWLSRYRLLLDEVEVWFLDGDRLERLA